MGVNCGPPFMCHVGGGYFCDQVKGGVVLLGGGCSPFYRCPCFAQRGMVGMRNPIASLSTKAGVM